ncbi:MAG: histidinol-phosphate transaminase [Candidatus Acidiferrales bacterium]
MPSSPVSRRDFARTVGQSLAVAVAAPGLLSAQAANRHQPEPESGIRLNYNESPYGPSPKAMQALVACGHIASRYPDTAHGKMTDAIAHMHGVQSENVLLGCGSTEILQVCDATFLGAGKNAVVAEPTFETVLEYASVMQADPVKIPLTADHRHDLPRMAASCTSKTGLVYVCNPNNPTGTIVTRDEFAQFVPRIPPSTLILVDEAYYDFADDPKYGTALGWVDESPNVVVARTFSKIYGMAGMRLGYAIGAKETIAQMRKEILQMNGNAAVLAAAFASLSDREWISETLQKMNGSRRWLCEQLAKDGRAFIPSQANFVMIDMGSDVGPYIGQFTARKILVGRRFSSMGSFLRVSIGTQPQMESFVAALREIAPVNGARAA